MIKRKNRRKRNSNLKGSLAQMQKTPPIINHKAHI